MWQHKWFEKELKALSSNFRWFNYVSANSSQQKNQLNFRKSSGKLMACIPLSQSDAERIHQHCGKSSMNITPWCIRNKQIQSAKHRVIWWHMVTSYHLSRIWSSETFELEFLFFHKNGSRKIWNCKVHSCTNIEHGDDCRWWAQII